MNGRLRGLHRAKGGLVEVEFSLSPSYLIWSLVLGGALGGQLPASALERLATSFEGAPLDRDVLTQVAKRSFQELQISVEGVFPEDVVLAILAAQ